MDGTLLSPTATERMLVEPPVATIGTVTAAVAVSPSVPVTLTNAKKVPFVVVSPEGTANDHWLVAARYVICCGLE